MKTKIFAFVYLLFVLIAINLVVGFRYESVFAMQFPNLTFTYGDKSFNWNLGKMANEKESHYAIFDKQKKYLEAVKVGLDKSAKILKSQNKTDEQVLFDLLPDFEDVYKQMSKEIEREFKETQIKFSPSSAEMFTFTNGCEGVKIDDSAMLKDIVSGKTKIEIKTIIESPKFTKEDLIKNTSKRSTQSTSFAGSEAGRKFNLKKAMATFNGLVVMPNEIVSFNKVLNSRDDGQPYKEAIIISNGEFTKGIGGGICQASTTIYNAVLMAGLEVLEVHRHTLPVGYVEKGFDAMVNDGGVDMRFKNNTKMPIYIKTYSKDDNVYAEVYGTPLNDIWYKKVSEKVRDIEPADAKIIPDVDGKYISKIKYKGEFYTEKYAKKGYEVKGYLYTYKGDEVMSIKLVRHEKYLPTQAVIYEGVQEPPLADNKVNKV
ncbi:MAG: VanW family protein [Christensenellales bacterium]